MSEYAVNDPQAVNALIAEMEAMKQKFFAMADAEYNRPKKGKYGEDLRVLEAADLPLIELSATKYTNKKGEVNIASMRSNFKRNAEEMKLGYVPSVVEFDGAIFLVNFDAANAEKKFEEFVLKRAGIDAATLRSITADLDAATRTQ